MDYLTKYYKNLSEQLQRKIFILEMEGFKVAGEADPSALQSLPHVVGEADPSALQSIRPFSPTESPDTAITISPVSQSQLNNMLQQLFAVLNSGQIPPGWNESTFNTVGQILRSALTHWNTEWTSYGGVGHQVYAQLQNSVQQDGLPWPFPQHPHHKASLKS